VDAVLEKRWREALPPFDGSIVLSRYLRVDELRAELSQVVAVLPRSDGMSTFLDWHQHDGYVTRCDPETWSSLEAAVSDDAQFTR
jgi:hypothetical protein